MIVDTGRKCSFTEICKECLKTTPDTDTIISGVLLRDKQVYLKEN